MNSDFSLNDCLFGGVKSAINADLDKFVCSGYGIGFESRSEFSLPDGSKGKNVFIFGVDMSSSVHIDNKEKNIWIPGFGQKQRLDDMLTRETPIPIKSSRSNRKFCLSLPGNGSNSFLFGNSIKMYQFKAKDSETKKYPLC